jgi:hypothetical protein
LREDSLQVTLEERPGVMEVLFGVGLGDDCRNVSIAPEPSTPTA